MREKRITNNPAPGVQTHVQSKLTEEAERREGDLSDPRRLWTHLRYAARCCLYVIYSAAFVLLCWQLSGENNGNIRVIAGPVLFFRTHAIIDYSIGLIGILFLVPSMFAVIMWPNRLTVLLSIVASFCWLLIGIWVEGTASC